jgi:hypothetical protein
VLRQGPTAIWGLVTFSWEPAAEVAPERGWNRQLYPWESVGSEQLLLAELLYAQGDYREALRIADNLDAPGRPETDLIYLPGSLSVRIRAARALRDTDRAEQYRARLLALGRDDLVGAVDDRGP